MRPALDSPVVALDIDGTMGDYHGHFTRFIEQWTGRPMPDPAAMTGGVPFYKHLGVSKATYRQAKLAYRQGGLKRSMPVYDGVGEFTRYVRRQGAQVWICTTRPYLRLDNIDPDTRHWLVKRAKAQYDGILFGQYKYRDLVRAVGRERVLVVYDDLPELIEQALSLGLRAMLRRQPYNEQYERSGNWGRVDSVEGMQSVFDYELKEWRNRDHVTRRRRT